MSIPVPLEGFGGGGGAGLNFDVKAYATEEALLAASPKENTIGVITEHKITGWMFDAADPAEPVNGMVYITTGTSSDVAFNALKKNGIQVYPLSAKQCVDGKSVNIDAYIYQNEEWAQFSANAIYLYKKGDECSTLTGGWTTGYIPSDYGYSEGSMVSSGNVLKITADSLEFVAAITKNKINLANYNTLTFVVDSVTIPSQAYGYLCVYKTSNTSGNFGSENASVKKQLSNNSPGTFALDISNVNSSYIVGFSIEADASTGSISVSEVYLS